MYNFDPVINYGPNDAGVSALSIVVGIFAIAIAAWLLGALYAVFSNLIKGFKNKGNEE